MIVDKPNLNYIKEISRGDKNFEKQLIDVLKDEFPKEVKEYRAALEKKDFIYVADRVHKIKHKIGILGLEKGFKTAADYEESLKKGDFKKEQLVFESILKSIEKFIQSL